MKNFNYLIVILFGLIVMSSAVFSQSVDIAYKEKWKNIYSATICFSGENGEAQISPEEFLRYEDVYFTLIPNQQSERGYFKDNDLTDDLMHIELWQDGKPVVRSRGLQQILNSDGKIVKVLYIYPKREVKLYKPFVFKSPIDTADRIIIKDDYYPYFSKYDQIYREGMAYSDDRDYVKAFNTLMPVIEDAGRHSEIKYYSFYQHLSETLMETAIRQRGDSLRVMFENCSMEMVRKPGKENLAKIDSVINLIKESYDLFTPYLTMDFPKSEQLMKDYRQNMVAAEKERENLFDLYKNYRLSFFEKRSYDDYKFSFFVDLLARMATHLDTLRILNGPDTLSLAMLENLPGKKKELHEIRGQEEFAVLVNLINEDIRNHGYLLNDSIMKNLRRQVEIERQPYYQIFKAFNALGEDYTLFRSSLSNAMEKCTDLDLVKNMEMWILSSNITAEALAPQTVTDINRGIMLVRQQKWDEGEQKLNILTRLAGNVAPPWYYAGEILYNKGEPFAAEVKFDRALLLYPGYVAPRLFKFDILFEKGDFEGLLKNVEEALAINDIWLFRFWKARALYMSDEFAAAVNEINEGCQGINPYDLEQYFLLGDAYLAMKKYKDAEAAYHQAVTIDPWATDRFNEKMKLLQDAR
ncbi:MAG: tetratricopeptide repeat protein [Bacteroidales bacterium]